MAHDPNQEYPKPLRALDINAVGFTALSFMTKIAADVTGSEYIGSVSEGSGVLAGILALTALGSHAASRKL